jgi:hypothetical protein
MEFINFPDQNSKQCRNCKYYCQSAFFCNEGKCSHDFPDLYDVKDRQTCDHFEKGIPARDEVVGDWDLPEQVKKDFGMDD